jgi:hypothetical protein
VVSIGVTVAIVIGVVGYAAVSHDGGVINGGTMTQTTAPLPPTAAPAPTQTPPPTVTVVAPAPTVTVQAAPPPPVTTTVTPKPTPQVVPESNDHHAGTVGRANNLPPVKPGPIAFPGGDVAGGEPGHPFGPDPRTGIERDVRLPRCRMR